MAMCTVLYCTRTVCNPTNGLSHTIDFVVFKESLTPLLGLEASLMMGLVEVKEKNFERVHSVKVEDKYCDVMEGALGVFPGDHTVTKGLSKYKSCNYATPTHANSHETQGKMRTKETGKTWVDPTCG